MHKTGTVYWLTGLPGAGKTSLAKLLHEHLQSKGRRPVVLLDGDQMRGVLGLEQAHNLDERQKLALTYGRLCHFLAHQGLDTVCATVSLFHLVQNWNRQNIPHYIEILIEVPLATLMQRDQKQLYSQAYRGEIQNVLGFDLEPQWPRSPDLIVHNDGRQSIQEVFVEMVDYLNIL